MPESLRDVIEDIRTKLKNNAYQNEEHVRLSLVARLVQALGWDIWNPGEVNTEFNPTSNEDRTKIDMALFRNTSLPAVLIEIKAVGRLEGNLSLIETAVRDYNRDITAPFSIITDGKIWRFYYVKGDGTFDKKRFDTIDLLDQRGSFELARIFDAYLAKSSIMDNSAEEIARDKLKLTYVQLALADAYPEAVAATSKEPFPSLPEALMQATERRGHRISRQDAVAFIRSRDGKQVVVQPTAPTPVKYSDEPKPPHPPDDSNKFRGGATGFGSTKLRGFKFRGIYSPVRNWANLLPELSVIISKQVTDFDRVLSLQGRTRPYYDRSDKDMRKGKIIKGTNYYVESHGDPNELARRAHLLLKTFNIAEDELTFDAHKR